jgi:hypothetical protein
MGRCSALAAEGPVILGFVGAVPLFWLLNNPSELLAQLGYDEPLEQCDCCLGEDDSMPSRFERLLDRYHRALLSDLLAGLVQLPCPTPVASRSPPHWQPHCSRHLKPALDLPVSSRWCFVLAGAAGAP